MLTKYLSGRRWNLKIPSSHRVPSDPCILSNVNLSSWSHFGSIWKHILSTRFCCAFGWKCVSTCVHMAIPRCACDGVNHTYVTTAHRDSSCFPLILNIWMLMFKISMLIVSLIFVHFGFRFLVCWCWDVNQGRTWSVWTNETGIIL